MVKKVLCLQIFVLFVLAVLPVSNVLASVPSGPCPPGYEHTGSREDGSPICTPIRPRIGPPTTQAPTNPTIPPTLIPRIIDTCWDIYGLYCDIRDIFDDEE